ncbi:MAG: sulfatase [Myxococcales bacterium]|nr:sulfatase [Myxococcales bacterium]
MMRSYRVLLALIIMLCACNKTESLSGAAARALGQGEVSNEALDDLHKQIDFIAQVHLADVYDPALVMDFGTPARLKYSGGNWKSGWGSDGRAGDISYTHIASNTARTYFPVDRPRPLTVRVRVKPIGSRNLTLYINNKALPSVALDSPAFKDYDIAVPAENVVAGENHLLWRLGGTQPHRGENVSIAVDWVRVFTEPVPADYVGLVYGGLVQKVKAKGEMRQALVLRTPERISWYTEVPKDSQLGFRLANLTPQGLAEFEVTVSTDDAGSKTVYQGKAHETWTTKLVSLDRWAGQTVRVDMLAKSKQRDVRLAVAEPGIYRAKREILEIKAHAKNVVLLIIDTMRADKLRPYNAKTQVRTPVLDQVSKEGVVFAQAQAPENWTKPSVASILTSLYPESHHTKDMEAKLPEAALLISEQCKKEGLTTGSFIANGHVSDRFGFKQGWDYYTNYIREQKNSEAERVFSDAGAWIEKNKDKRFFAFIQTIDPHVPYDPPDEFLKQYDAQPYAGPVEPRRTAEVQVNASQGKITLSARDKHYLEALYDGEVSYHDHHLGIFIERLKKMGVYDDTLFVITADHGEEIGDHGKYGHGHTVYQELLHVPMSYRFPKAVPSERTVQYTVSTVDIAPTILTLSGINVPDVMEGHALFGYMHGVAPDRPSVAFSDFLDNRRVIRAGRWKFVQRGGRGDGSLFDLLKDPKEQHELNASKAPIAWRYTRGLLGQFLGAKDRHRWYAAAQGTSKQLKGESTHIDEETRKQLCALGYGNCDKETP